jgi:hypothetical protein
VVFDSLLDNMHATPLEREGGLNYKLARKKKQKKRKTNMFVLLFLRGVFYFLFEKVF